ncbi:MAG: hypothetical protein R2932_56830 [Caldilineaceae bacterium]
MLVAFLSTHIPLLTLFFYAIAATDLAYGAKTQILIVALVATLIRTGILSMRCTSCWHQSHLPF